MGSGRRELEFTQLKWPIENIWNPCAFAQRHREGIGAASGRLDTRSFARGRAEAQSDKSANGSNLAAISQNHI